MAGKLRPSDGWLHQSMLRLLDLTPGKTCISSLSSLLLSSLQVLTLTSHLLRRPVLSCYSLEFPETISEDVRAPLWTCLSVVTHG